MRKIDLLAACVAFGAATSMMVPPNVHATYRPPPTLDEEIWGYCCSGKGVRCCARNGCEISSGGCVRL